MKYLFIILCIQISHKECTIDISLSDFGYLSDHLTTAECQRLFASLHFISYDLPENLDNAVKKVPKDIPCIKLLLRWSSGQEKWEGKRKTHMEIEHRLRQIGRKDLADWLGKTAYHNVAKDLNHTLTNATYFENNKIVLHNNLITDQGLKSYTEEWTAVDSILWVLLIGVLGTVLIAFCRLIHLAYKKSVAHKDGEELIDLLSVASMESDVEETIYEFRADNEGDKKSANDDLNKVKS